MENLRRSTENTKKNLKKLTSAERIGLIILVLLVLAGPLLYIVEFIPFILMTPFPTIGLLGIIASMVEVRDTKNWLTTTGIIREVQFQEDDQEHDDTYYSVAIKYSYIVSGITYEGNRIALKYSSSNKQDKHQKIYEKLNSAKQVEVRYNPLQPDNVILVYGMYASDFISGSVVMVTVWWVGSLLALWHDLLYQIVSNSIFRFICLALLLVPVVGFFVILKTQILDNQTLLKRLKVIESD